MVQAHQEKPMKRFVSLFLLLSICVNTQSIFSQNVNFPENSPVPFAVADVDSSCNSEPEAETANTIYEVSKEAFHTACHYTASALGYYAESREGYKVYTQLADDFISIFFYLFPVAAFSMDVYCVYDIDAKEAVRSASFALI